MTDTPEQAESQEQSSAAKTSTTAANADAGAANAADTAESNAAGAAGPRMKPLTAAKKLGIYLPATPEEFRTGGLTRAEFTALQDAPPEWLETLRREGPHPRPEVARKLGITITALKANGMDKPLTTAEIKELLAEMPEWLAEARQSLAAEREAQIAAARRKSGER